MALFTIKNEYLEVFRKAYEEETLSFFVGSGFSTSCDPANYGGWGSIIQKLKEELSDELKDENDYLKLAQIYEANKSRAKLLKVVKDSFPPIDIPDELHKSLIKCDVHNIITTNWDCLIENAAKENLSIYDTIVSDNELLKSKHQNKILKIHGDFKHKNIIFSEQDYLNYSDKFPIIENYVKNIVATNTLILLGYSFNDLDFKQLVNWVNRKVSKRSIYMITTDLKTVDEIHYYEKSFGIKIIQICEKKEESKEAFISFFDYLKYEKYIPELETPESYVYRYLKPYEKYPVILRRFIQKSLSNCSFVYDSNQETILELNQDILTIDSNKEKRKVLKKFYDSISELKSKKDKTFEKIIKILQKADIEGISTDTEILNKNKFIRISKKIGNSDFYINPFNFLYNITTKKSIREKMSSVFSLYSLERFEEAYILNKQVLMESKFQEDYANYFIALLNNNSILHTLKYSFKAGIDCNKKYRNENSISIQDEYIRLSVVQRKQVQQIFEFATLNTLNLIINQTRDELKKIQKNRKIIADGGIAYSTELGHRTNHKNLVDFVINSSICIENHETYWECCQNYVDMYLINTQIKKYVPNKTEIYSLIRYFDTKQLLDKLSCFCQNNTSYTLEINTNLHNWLINTVLYNNVNNYINKNNPFTDLERTINNTLFILSLVKNTKNQTSKILDQINKVIKNARNDDNLLMMVDSFFVNQYVLYKGTNIKGQPAINVFETLIQKFIEDKCNLHEIESLLSYKLINVCNVGIQNSNKFSNIDLLNKLLKNINKMQRKSEQYRFIEHLVMVIYQMTDENCKKVITDFISRLDVTQNKSTSEYCTFMLTLKSLGFKVNDNELKESINSFLESISENSFSSVLFGLQFRLDKIINNDVSYKLYSDKITVIKNKYEDIREKMFSKESN